MLKKPQKPIKRHKSKKGIANTWKPYNCKFEYACTECHGYGWIYDPNDPPSPVDGNRGRDRLTCQKCKGSGEGKLSDYNEQWKNSQEYHKEQVEKYKRDMILYKSILAKLTEEELDYIRRYV